MNQLDKSWIYRELQITIYKLQIEKFVRLRRKEKTNAKRMLPFDVKAVACALR